ncbi:hypothetical protein N8587_01320 [Akkermansiaceae bacterium]|nr:hypothetical protein [Akkermansiaceae bacterium]
MGIDSGFAFDGFVDDKEEKEMWGNVEKKLAKSSVSPTKDDTDYVDGKMEVNDNGKSDWQEDMQKSSIKEYKKKNVSNNKGFFKRNKKQIFDALILLGIIYVGYKLFFEQEDGGDYESGGEVDFTPTPQSMPETPATPTQAPPPPRPELPEATFTPEK